MSGSNNNSLDLTRRTHKLDQLSINDVGSSAVVMGWVQKTRNLGNMIFVDLRDRYSILQVVFEDEALVKEASQLKNEYVIAVSGSIRPRPDGMINTKMLTGQIELKVDKLKILNKSEVLPFQVTDTDVSEHLRLKYRYLDLRREKMRNNILARSRFIRIVRNCFEEEGFLDIETPFLHKSTPEGARDFVVPSRIHKGKFFALPQSPQLFKQILMIAGFDKYYQLAKCFRDEDLRADRQPEFTQIDCEMSFVDQEEILQNFERIMRKIISSFLNKKDEDLFPKNLPRIKYWDAIADYGSDKPDIRYENKLIDISSIVKGAGFKVFDNILEQEEGIVNCICFKDSASYFTRKVLDNLSESSKKYGLNGLSWVKKKEDGSWAGPLSKYFSKEICLKVEEKTGLSSTEDTLLIGAGSFKTIKLGLGTLRTQLAKELNLYDKNDVKLLWVTEFPMFEKNDDGSISAAHHPFTSYFEEDDKYLFSEPLKVRSKAYDMVLNGVELASGSIRIHDPNVQSKVFEAIGLKKDEIISKFGFLLEAFKYGAPPHGGIAFGLDRLLMLLLQEESIKEVIPFPKTNKATDLMTEAPGVVSDKDLKDLGIKIVEKEEEDSENE